MDRRDFLSGLLSASAIARAAPALLVATACDPGDAAPTPARRVPAPPPPAPPADAIDVVKRFGFVGDGKADNYEAFHRLAAYANGIGGGSFVFPPGTYYVAQYRTAPIGTRDRRQVINAEYTDCGRLNLHGYGARIVLNGNFHRSGAKGRDGLTVGVHTSVFMPFEIRRCRNVTIRGFEMDGGVRGMTRDDNVLEAYTSLIALSACQDVLLQDLDLHHCQSDGILMSDDVILGNRKPGRACRNVRLQNVKCRNNGRGGLAPLQVYGMSAVDCEFSGNGFPGGKYKWHAPGFGVDIEPDRATEGVDIDTKTGNLEFVRCNFYDNFSAFLACYLNSFKGYCRLIDCNSRNRGNAPNHIIATWPGEGILIEGGTHDSGEGCIWISWQGQSGGTTILRKCKISSSHHFGILHSQSENIAVVEGCTITGTHRKPGLSGHFVFFGQNPGRGRRNIYRGNTLFLPAALHDRAHPFDIEPIFANTNLSDNVYTTDLKVPGLYFARNFDPKNCSVRNERFRGAFPGKQDSFRPMAGSEAYDTRVPFNAP
jgi:hypothetical protein